MKSYTITKHRNNCETEMLTDCLDSFNLSEHLLEVSYLATEIGRRLGLDEASLAELTIGSFYHDIGKTQLPKEILSKQEKLTVEEFELIKTHPTLGYELMLESLPKNSLEIIRDHHEQVDGKGYSAGKKANEISLMTKIVSVCDVYSAMTEDRPYRKAMTKEKALSIIQSEVGTKFDSKVVKELIAILD